MFNIFYVFKFENGGFIDLIISITIGMVDSHKEYKIIFNCPYIEISRQADLRSQCSQGSAGSNFVPGAKKTPDKFYLSGVFVFNK